MSVEMKIRELLFSAATQLAQNRLADLVESNHLSPIEKLMAAAFVANGICPGWMVVNYSGEGHPANFDRLKRVKPGTWRFNEIRVYPQAIVGPYRADFLACSTLNYSDDARNIFLAIECDGHDFHEKTKEQASRDKARDRFFVKEGISVMRFSGSDIWRSPSNCVEEIVDYFKKFHEDYSEKHYSRIVT